ncbi:amino acid ABC transporter permease [Streptomyces sp. NPDC047002]|uniref:amino acid ABC transporter permease n=1 Tax=Streptomyces sp. NPDC047002 TaxID=3155475 RepID=UPI003455EAE8
MSGHSVLYDAPGARARRRNILYTAVFLTAFAFAVWWLLSAMADKQQLTAAKWRPFVTDPEVWTTYLLPGLRETLLAAGLSIVIALPVGALLGLGRLSDHAWVRVPVGVVVEFFRAVPVLLMMVFAAQLYVQFSSLSSDVRPLYAVVTGLVLYNASVLAEIVRAGILSLPRGQSDAALAIGMRKGQTMVSVLLPQAVTAMLPVLVSQLVVIVKDTALGGALLGLPELLSQNRTITANYGANTIAAFTVIALLYIAVNSSLTRFAGWLERRLRRARRSGGVVLAADATDGVEEIAATTAKGAGPREG